MTKLSWEEYKKANIAAVASPSDLPSPKAGEESIPNWDSLTEKKKKEFLKKVEDLSKAEVAVEEAAPADIEE